MLELYHNINSVCAQKVRIALSEKGQEAKEHLLTLRGDHSSPHFLPCQSSPSPSIPSPNSAAKTEPLPARRCRVLTSTAITRETRIFR